MVSSQLKEMRDYEDVLCERMLVDEQKRGILIEWLDVGSWRMGLSPEVPHMEIHTQRRF